MKDEIFEKAANIKHNLWRLDMEIEEIEKVCPAPEDAEEYTLKVLDRYGKLIASREITAKQAYEENRAIYADLLKAKRALEEEFKNL